MKAFLSKMRPLSLIKDAEVIRCLGPSYSPEHGDQILHLHPLKQSGIFLGAATSIGPVFWCVLKEPPYLYEQDRSQHKLNEISLQSLSIILVD